MLTVSSQLRRIRSASKPFAQTISLQDDTLATPPSLLNSMHVGVGHMSCDNCS